MLYKELSLIGLNPLLRSRGTETLSYWLNYLYTTGYIEPSPIGLIPLLRSRGTETASHWLDSIPQPPTSLKSASLSGRSAHGWV